MPAGSISPVKAEKAAQVSERKEQHRSERQERAQARQERKQQSDQAAVVKLSQQSGGQSQSANVEAPAAPAPAPAPAPAAKKAENFIGSTAGAKVVNFAVQGARDGNKIAIFASGEGPNAKKVAEPKKEDKKEEVAKTVDTQA